MYQYLICYDNILLRPRINLWLAEVQEYTLYLINVGKLTMVHIFQDQFLNQVHKASTMNHALKKWL